MRVYLAAAYARKLEMRAVETFLSDIPNVVITSRWLGEETGSYCPPDPPGRARMDVEDIEACDVLVRFTDNLVGFDKVPARLATGARMWETGFAFASGKPCIIVGGHQCVFDYLPHMIHVRGLAELRSWLKEHAND